jgi:RNA polymerase sigma-70 factor (ECF subfamily)
MNREDLNWLLQSIEDPETEKRFVVALYGRGRISSQVMADLARERGWLGCTVNPFSTNASCHSTDYQRRRNDRLRLTDGSSQMPRQYFEYYSWEGTGGSARRSATAREESAFLAAAKRGDSAAFEILCRRSADRVFHVARRITWNEEDAEDVVQESFQLAFVHLKSFKGDSRFSTWLTRIAINAALMKLRKKQHRVYVSLDESAETKQPPSGLEAEDQELNPEQLYAQDERLRLLSAALNELTPGVRKAIKLRELDERSTEETARIMGISVAAVKARVFHGRKKLRDKLKHHLGSLSRTYIPQNEGARDMSG